MKVTIADLKTSDNYTGLSAAVALLMDTALTAIAAVFAQSISTDADGTQGNIKDLLNEAADREVIS